MLREKLAQMGGKVKESISSALKSKKFRDMRDTTANALSGASAGIIGGVERGASLMAGKAKKLGAQAGAGVGSMLGAAGAALRKRFQNKKY